MDKVDATLKSATGRYKRRGSYFVVPSSQADGGADLVIVDSAGNKHIVQVKRTASAVSKIIHAMGDRRSAPDVHKDAVKVINTGGQRIVQVNRSAAQYALSNASHELYRK